MNKVTNVIRLESKDYTNVSIMERGTIFTFYGWDVRGDRLPAVYLKLGGNKYASLCGNDAGKVSVCTSYDDGTPFKSVDFIVKL